MNQMMLEQMQAINAQLAARSKMINTLMDQLAKGQLREGYGSSVKNYPNYLSDLQDDTSEFETICTADMKPVCLGEFPYGPYPDHTDRTPEEFQTEKLEIEKEPKAQAEAEAYGPHKIHTDRTTSQTEQITPELKPLPATLRYEFLDSEKTCPVILNADLNPDRTATLLGKLKAHISAIGCSIKDLKDMGWIFLLQVFENTALRPDPPPDRTAGLLEDLKTQRTVIGNLIEKLTGMNPAAYMHRTLPVNDHSHTDRANQHTSRAQPTWSMPSLSGRVKKERMVYPFGTFNTAFHQKPPDPPPTNPATCEVRTLPVDHHTVRTYFHTVRTLQKWALLPDPPDLPLTNQ